MPQLSESAAEKLAPEQAAEVVHILDLQARWENHRDDPAKSAASVSDLHGRQKAFDAFRVAWRNYAAAHRDARLPEPTQNVPDRLAVWCRALRGVPPRGRRQRRRGGGEGVPAGRPDRGAHGREPIARVAADDVPAAILALDAVIAWCEAAMVPALDAPKAEAA